MDIETKITVTQFYVRRVVLTLNEVTDTLESTAEIVLLNAEDRHVAQDRVEIPWTPVQEDVIKTTLRDKKLAYATAHGWTEHIGD